jgi:hypothetical protein
MGENGANLPHVFSVIAETIMQEVLDAQCEVYVRLLNIIRQVQVRTKNSVTLSLPMLQFSDI